MELNQVWGDFGSIMSLKEGKSHLYLIDLSFGLRILDLDDHSMSGQTAFAAGLQTLVENGEYLYVTGSLEGLLTIDRRQLRSRQVVKWIRSLPGVSDGMIVDDLFYFGFKHAGVGGVAFVDKRQDTAVHFPDASRLSLAIARYQDLLFATQTAAGLKVFDISTRTRPRLVADWPDYAANRLVVVNDFLISYSMHTGLRVTNVADINAVRVVEELAAPQIIGMVAMDHYLVCVTYDQGLLIYRVFADGKLEQVSRLQAPFPAQQFDQQVDIDVRDGMAYIANGRSGLLIVDINDPQNPQLVSSIALPGYIKGVRIHQDLVYLVSLRDGIHLVDVSRPAQPLLIGTVPLGRLSKFLLIDDGLLYFFQDTSGISAIPLPHFARSVKRQARNQLQVVMPAPTFPGRYNLLVSNRYGTVNHSAIFEIYEEPGGE